MLPGKAQEFTVTFSPDHESLYFSDLLQVVLFEKVEIVAGPPQVPPHSGRDPWVSLICPSLETFIIWHPMLEDVRQMSASLAVSAPPLNQPRFPVVELLGRLPCFLVLRKSPTRSS